MITFYGAQQKNLKFNGWRITKADAPLTNRRRFFKARPTCLRHAESMVAPASAISIRSDYRESGSPVDKPVGVDCFM